MKILILTILMINNVYAFNKINKEEYNILINKKEITKQDWESILLYRMNLQKERIVCSRKRHSNPKICYSKKIEEQYAINWKDINQYLREHSIIKKDENYTSYKNLTKEGLIYLIIKGSESTNEFNQIAKKFGFNKDTKISKKEQLHSKYVNEYLLSTTGLITDSTKRKAHIYANKMLKE